MDLATFEKAEKIVYQIRELEREHISFQEIVAGGKSALVIATDEGELDIKDTDRVRKIICDIEEVYWKEEERLKDQLSKL